jgi:acyl-CoA synthetase (AMP-forming)/AMP-acid ligase II
MTPPLVSDIVPHWAQRTPDRIALREASRDWTYRELNAAIEDAAARLAASGVRGGDRVMLVCENCAAAVALYFACTVIGAWPIVVNARMTEREIEEIRAHSGARLVIRAKLSGVAFSALNEDCAPEAGRDIAALIYTSGTTGKPKGVMLSHANLMFVARASGEARALSADDRVYAVLPVSHILGLTGVLLGSLLAGATVHLVSRFDPAAALSADISVMIGTPTMYAMLAEYAQRKKAKPRSLRLISSAGAPLDAATKAAAESALGRTLHNGYGITECGPTIALTPLDAPRNDCGIGRLIPGVEAKLVADELYVRSPGVMKGYYKSPEETAAAIDGEGWFRTGDLARFEDGSWFIAGRAKEMIIRFGFNVYPAEIEGVLNAHPSVARAAVIGRAKDGTEDILAFIHAAPGTAPTSAELADYAAAQLAPYKRPTEIHLLAEMPLSPAGKILKNELRALAEI